MCLAQQHINESIPHAILCFCVVCLFVSSLLAANLLLNKGELKLADFGLATNFLKRPVFSTNVVTLWYRAPELLLGANNYGPKVDMWSVG